MTTRPVEIDVWLRGTTHATTCPGPALPADTGAWTDQDVRSLLVAMLLAIDGAKNPGADRAQVALRGFSWIVSPYEGGHVIHVEMQTGTASAGPFTADEPSLTATIRRVIAAEAAAAETVH
ncbi:MAG: hypothetical protein AB7H88_21255 [Vicinamibacterales bacterium]